jgi:hypothetical protein
MVGQDQELCKSTLNLDRTPDSLPSYLNDFVFSLIEESVKTFDSVSPFGSTSTFRYATGAFSGGSDHAEFTDSTIGVPCVMLLQWPDLYYHTSMDTIDKVSPDSLKRVGWIATVAALTLASAGVEEAFLLAAQTASRGIGRIEEAGRGAVEALFEKKEDKKLKDKPEEMARGLAKAAQRYENKMEHFVWREQQGVKSVVRLQQSQELKSLLDEYCKDIADFGKKEVARLHQALNFIAKTCALTLPVEVEASDTNNELRKLVPRRLFKGTLDFEALRKGLSEKEFEWYREIDEKDPEFHKKAAEILNFMDGKRSSHEILKAVSAEYSETNPEYMLKFLRDLEKMNLVAF